LQACVRYVERNPVEAGLCRSPEDWEWSWSNARARLESTEDLVQRNQIDHHSQTGRPLGDAGFIGEIERLTGRSFALSKR